MLSPIDYLHLGQACVDLADKAEDPERSTLLQLAQAWFALASYGYVLLPPDPFSLPPLR